jgi:acetolactate synthase I/II/III large subunit
LVKVTDYIAEFLAQEKIKYVFGLTGGAVVHLFDSLARNPKIHPIFTHHEQAAAFAAEAYARVSDNLGAAFVTTGPGGTNAITGVAGAWLDSIPCIYISGQARLAHTTHNKPVRQIGTQQLDIIPLVKPITKYAVMVDDPAKIKYHLQKAVWLARNGRPGPVWLDIPLDIQWQQIEPKKLPGFDPTTMRTTESKDKFSSGIAKCLNYLAKAKRPLILVGHGVKLAKAEDEIKILIKRYNIPAVFSWNTLDILPTSNKLNIGSLGIQGQRGANLAVQNCDLLICLGSHLGLALTGTLAKAFAREAKIIMVDIDENEFNYCTVQADLLIKTDVKKFLTALLTRKDHLQTQNIDTWRDKCDQYKTRYNKIEPVLMKKNGLIDAYCFIQALSDCLNNHDVIVVDGGGTVTQFAFQALKFKNSQRLIISAGLCAMGSGLPEAIGACFANQKKRVICLSGDGSMQLNIQELQTIAHHRLPIKIFIFNNGGYLAIRNTQKAFLDGRYIGSGETGGLSLPDFLKVSRAYGIKAIRLAFNKQIKRKIRSILENNSPAICEIMLSKNQQILPHVGYNKNRHGGNVPRPLEDMFPFLSRKELEQVMEIKHWDQGKD